MGYRPKQRILSRRSSIGQKYLRNFLTSLVIGEIQIKTTLRYHLTLVRMAKVKNTEHSLCWRGCEVRGTFLHTGGSVNLYSCFENQYGSFSENWDSIYLKTQQCHSWAYTQRIFIPQGHLLNYVHSSIICNRQNVETI